MLVMKFGGVILKNRNGFDALLNILESKKDEKALLVISAFSTATRDLKKAARTAEKGDETLACSMLDRIIDTHIQFTGTLLKDKAHSQALGQSINLLHTDIGQLLRGIAITREATPRTMDLILSYGELLALKIIDAFLRDNGFNHICIDSTELVVSDSHFGNAAPNLELTGRKLRETLLPLLDQYRLVVTQGFVARDTNGEITTMGIESSGLSALVFAGLLGTGQLDIWTDVEGIRSADPKAVNGTCAVPGLSVEEARLAADSGFKLIIQPMIDLMMSTGIAINYRSAFNPEGGMTVFSPDSRSSGLPFIVIKTGLFVCKYRTGSKTLAGDIGRLADSSNGAVFYSQFIINSGHILHITEEETPLSVNAEVFRDVNSIVIINCTTTAAGKIVEKLSSVDTTAHFVNYRYFGDEQILKILLSSEAAALLLPEIHRIVLQK